MNNPTGMLRILIIILLLLGNFSLAQGSELNLNSEFGSSLSLNLNPFDAINSAGIDGINTKDIVNAFQFNFPFNLQGLKNINTNIPISPKSNPSNEKLPNVNLKQFLSPKDISSNDLAAAIKTITILIIEIFLVVLSVTYQILKLILGFLR